jgi:hypothetical protein
MAMWQYQIFLADGRRGGERVIVNPEADGCLPFRLTLPDPGATTSTTYWLMPSVKDGQQLMPTYQSDVSEGSYSKIL